MKSIWFLPEVLCVHPSEAPKDSFFLNTQGDVPLKSDFRPTVKVLSRKPTPKAASTAVVSGFDQLAVEDDDEDDEADAGKYVMTPEERQQKSLREREEKQKKYQEARQRLFGSGTTSETQSKENNVRSPAQQNGESRFQSKDRGRDGRPSSSKSNKKLYEPDAVKTDSNCTYKQENQTESAPIEQHPIRSPRGPENNGRGCFGFTSRGGREI